MGGWGKGTDGYVQRWVAKLVARRLVTESALGSRIQTSLKNHKRGNISKGVVNPLYCRPPTIGKIWS